MRVVRVRQSFHTARKGGKFLVEKEALVISGADIELLRNGEPVSVTEESPGHYQPDTEIIVEAGDHFEIHVHKDGMQDRKSTRLNSSHVAISDAVFCLKKKKKTKHKIIRKSATHN